MRFISQCISTADYEGYGFGNDFSCLENKSFIKSAVVFSVIEDDWIS